MADCKPPEVYMDIEDTPLLQHVAMADRFFIAVLCGLLLFSILSCAVA